MHFQQRLQRIKLNHFDYYIDDAAYFLPFSQLKEKLTSLVGVEQMRRDRSRVRGMFLNDADQHVDALAFFLSLIQ